MTSLSDGCSDRTEPQRQVMVVDANPERRAKLCALLRHHGLLSVSVSPDALAMESQVCAGVALVANHSDQVSGWDLARRINTFAPRLPVVLLGPGDADAGGDLPTIQAVLPDDASGERIAAELKHWLAICPAVGDRVFVEQVSPGTSGVPRHADAAATVLLVDDDARIRAILKSFLELRGFAVTSVDSGEAALQAIAQGMPRAVLLDMKMPGMDGLLTLKHIRVQQPNLPVVIITNMDDEGLIQEAELLGANDYLIKPFNLEHLEAVLLTKILA